MEKYLHGVFAVAAVVTVCSLLIYKKSRITRLAFSVLLVYTALSPLSALIPGMGEIDLGGLSESVGEVDGEYREIVERAFSEGVQALISSELGLSGDNVRIICHGFDTESMTAESITVLLSGSALSADRIKIKQVIEENGLGKCEVEIAVG